MFIKKIYLVFAVGTPAITILRPEMEAIGTVRGTGWK